MNIQRNAIEQSFHQELVSVNADLAGDLDLSFQEGHDLITKFLPTANPGSTAGDVLEEACGSAIDINISMKSIHGELNETMRSEFSELDASRASIRTDFGEEALESGVPLDVFFQRYKPSATEADRSLDGLDLSTSSLNTFEGSSPIAHCSKNPFLAPLLPRLQKNLVQQVTFGEVYLMEQMLGMIYG